MRRVWLFALAAGCRFEHGVLARDAAVPDVPASDTAATDTGPPDSPVIPFCDPLDTTIVACYPLDGSAQDASGHNLNAMTSGVSFVPGRVGMAMQVGLTSAADVGDSNLFDLSAITIEAWIDPAQIPTAGLRAGIVDCEGQYGVFLHEQGRLQCTMINGTSMQIDAGIAPNAWTHVACTYDGATTTIYVNGVQRFQGSGGGTLATNGTTGISLAGNNPPATGSRLVGLLDEVRILNVARSAAGILADATRP